MALIRVMSFIDDWFDFWLEVLPEKDRGLSDGAEGSAVNDSPKGTALHLGGISASPSASSLSPLPDIPEMYLRHIPCEPCPSAVEEAARVLRR